jgi:tetratricopeptide (TPR) repeat protein
MHRLRPSGEPMDGSRRHSLIDDFIERVKKTGTILDGAERQAAQGILDYWTAEIISASDIGDDWDLPALLPFEGAAEKNEPPADVIQKRVHAHRGLELAATARLWKSSGSPGYLLTGAALEEADTYKTDPDVAELVRASRIYADGKERERSLKRRSFTAITALAALAIGVAVFAWSKWGEAISAQKMEALEAERERQIANGALHAVSNLLFSVDSVDEGVGILPMATTHQQLKIAKDLLDSLSRQQQRELTPARVELLTKLSDAYDRTGDHHLALSYAKSAEELAGKEDSGDEKWQRALYDSAFRVGDLLTTPDLKDMAGAKQEFFRAFDIARKYASAKPSDVEWQRRLVYIEIDLGDLFKDENDKNQSRQRYGNALTLSEQNNAKSPDRPVWRRFIANVHGRMGDLLQEEHPEEALVEYRAALKIRDELTRQYPQNRIYQSNLALTHINMGDSYRNEKKFEEALAQYRIALEITGNLVKYDPEVLASQVRCARMHDHIAEMHKEIAKTEADQHRLEVASKEYDDALKEYDEALHIYNEIANSAKFQDEPIRQRDLAREYGRNGDALKTRGDSTANQEDLRKAAESYRHGMAIIDAFMQKDPMGGKDLVPTRKELQEKIQNLPLDLQ